MKKVISTIVTAGMLLSVAQAQNIAVKTDWTLVGATEDITLSNLDNTCVDTVWMYNSADVNDWKVYLNSSSYPSMPQNVELKVNGTIKAGEGFWIKGTSECTVDTNTTTSPSTPSTGTVYALQNSDVSGKQFTIDGNDSQGWVVYTLNSDGSGTEIGYYENGSQEYAENITWSIQDKKLKVTLKSDDSVAYLSFESKPANGALGTYDGYDVMPFDVSNYQNISTSSVVTDLPADSLYSSWNFPMNSYSDMKYNFLTDPIANYFNYGGLYMFASSGSLCTAVPNTDPSYAGYNTYVRGTCSDTIGTWTESNDTMIATLANGDKAYFKVINGSVANYKPNDF